MKEKVSFADQLTALDAQFADQRTKLEELNKKLNEKFAVVRAEERRLYDELMAIVAREGGGVVNYADGGVYCQIDPSVKDGVRIDYRAEYGSGSPSRNDGIITKAEETAEDDPITDFQTLQKGYQELMSYAALVSAAQKVVDTYIGYQQRLVNENNKLIKDLTRTEDDDDDDNGYW